MPFVEVEGAVAVTDAEVDPEIGEGATIVGIGRGIAVVCPFYRYLLAIYQIVDNSRLFFTYVYFRILKFTKECAFCNYWCNKGLGWEQLARKWF